MSERSTEDVARLAYLHGALRQLEPDALEVVTEIVRRALVGQRQYGRLDLATDDRNFTAEGGEELVDGVFYFAAAAIRARRSGRR